METNDFGIGIKTVWVLVIGNILLTIAGALVKIQQWGFSQLLFTGALILFFSIWIIVISDMLKNKIYNKTFWIMSIFIIPYITPIFYLIQRNKLISVCKKTPITSLRLPLN